MITAICISSRYPEEVPVLDMKSETVVESLTLVFSWLSSSQKLHADLVTSFTINLTTAFFRKFSLKIIHSSSQHPESNLIEYWHQSVKTTLKVLCTKNGTDWKANLYAFSIENYYVWINGYGFGRAWYQTDRQKSIIMSWMRLYLHRSDKWK